MDKVLRQIGDEVAGAVDNLGSVRECVGMRFTGGMKLELNNAIDKLPRARRLVDGIEEFS